MRQEDVMRFGLLLLLIGTILMCCGGCATPHSHSELPPPPAPYIQPVPGAVGVATDVSDLPRRGAVQWVKDRAEYVTQHPWISLGTVGAGYLAVAANNGYWPFSDDDSSPGDAGSYPAGPASAQGITVWVQESSGVSVIIATDQASGSGSAPTITIGNDND